MIPGLTISNETLGTASLAFSLLGSVPYIGSIIKGHTQPHVLTWLNWGVVQGVVFLAQDVTGAGPGRWALGLNAGLCFLIVLLGLMRGEKTIMRSDWVSFILAFTMIPIWYGIRNPLYSVLLGTAIDALGYYPTFRKSWSKPYEENLLSYVIFTMGMALTAAALDTYNFTTLLYQAFTIIANCCLIAMLVVRRRAINRIPA